MFILELLLAEDGIVGE